MKHSIIVSLAVAIALPSPAVADSAVAIQPMQLDQEVIRYRQGIPTVEIGKERGVVKVTPLPTDHGSLAFAVAVYNDSNVPANFGTQSVAPSFGGKPVAVFSRFDLERKAKNRAFWSQFGLALLGATASGLAASSQSTYSATLVTPRGTYRSFYTVPSIYGQYQAAAITGMTVDAVALVSYQLDRTLAEIGDQTVQLTTLEPGESYAGRIVLDKIRPKELPDQITMTIHWNDEDYLFAFQIAKAGMPPPPYVLLSRPVRAQPGYRPPALPQRAAVREEPKAAESAAPVSGRFGNRHVRCITCY